MRKSETQTGSVKVTPAGPRSSTICCMRSTVTFSPMRQAAEEPEHSAGQRHHHQCPGGRLVVEGLIRRQESLDVGVDQGEGALVRVAGEAAAEQAPNGASGTVGAYHEAGAGPLDAAVLVLEHRGDILGPLYAAGEVQALQGQQPYAPLHLGAEALHPLPEDPLGLVLRKAYGAEVLREVEAGQEPHARRSS